MTLAVCLLAACGGGGDAEETTGVDITDQGFAASGIFGGDLDGVEVLLLLDQDEFFLLAGEVAARGSYGISRVSLSGVGNAFNPLAEEQALGTLSLSGEYKTDRHLELTWRIDVSGATETLIVEATPLYFEPSPLDSVLGAWINQDSSNLIFFTISENRQPIAGNDFVTQVADETEITIAVLGNDRDDDGDAIRIQEFDETSVRGGQVSLDDNGTPEDFGDDTLIYSIPPGFETGTDSFEYTIEDENDDVDQARVVITLPTESVDLTLDVSASDETPMAGDSIDIIVSVTNAAEVDARALVWVQLGDGIVYRATDAGTDFDRETGFWDVEVPALGEAILTINGGIDTNGSFTTSAAITSQNRLELNAADNADEITLMPGGLTGVIPEIPRSAQVEGLVFSSLSQITGVISESSDQMNAYGIELRLGAGGLGGNAADSPPFTGFVILSEELVVPETEDGSEAEPQLRDSMLILTTSSEGVFLNKLFGVRDEELEGNDEEADQ